MLSALDLLRTLGWGIISFIYSLIDIVFEILKQLNLYDIISSVADNTSFSNFHTGVLAIAVTLLALFIIWRFIMKILEPDEGLETRQIVMEIVKCSFLVILSVFLFSQANTFSTTLSGIFPTNDLAPFIKALIIPSFCSTTIPSERSFLIFSASSSLGI